MVGTEEKLQEIPPVEKLRTSITHELETFANNESLTELMGKFGYKPPADSASLEEKLQSLQTFTNEHWDARRGKERDQAGKILLPEGVTDESIKNVAKTLYMVEATQASKERYDGIVVLGAGGRYAWERTQRAKSAGKKSPTVFFLSGDVTYTTKAIEDLRQTEHPNDRDERTDTYDQRLLSLNEKYEGKIPEFEFMQAAAEIAYGERQDDGTYKLPSTYEKNEQEFGGETVITYRYEGDDPDNNPDIVLLRSRNRAPKDLGFPNGRPRANTEDTYKSFHELLPPTTKNLLMVTTGIFVPFQHLGARRLISIPYGINVETIGADTRRTPSFDKADKYLQEMNSGANEAVKLYDALKAPSSR